MCDDPEEGAAGLKCQAPQEKLILHDQAIVGGRYAEWAGLADEYIGALYGQAGHSLRGASPQYVFKAVLPRGGLGPRGSPEVEALRRLVQLGDVTCVTGFRIIGPPTANTNTTRDGTLRTWPPSLKVRERDPRGSQRGSHHRAVTVQ